MAFPKDFSKSSSNSIPKVTRGTHLNLLHVSWLVKHGVVHLIRWRLLIHFSFHPIRPIPKKKKQEKTSVFKNSNECIIPLILFDRRASPRRYEAFHQGSFPTDDVSDQGEDVGVYSGGRINVLIRWKWPYALIPLPFQDVPCVCKHVHRENESHKIAPDCNIIWERIIMTAEYS